MDASLWRTASDVARLFAADGITEQSCEVIAGRVVVGDGPSRFFCPPAYMKRVLDELVRGGHLAVRRARRNLYRLHPDAVARPPLPPGWFYGVHRGADRKWPVIVTDVWGNGGPVTLLYTAPEPGVCGVSEVWGGANWFFDLERRVGANAAREKLEAVAAARGWRLRRFELVAPWAAAPALAELLGKASYEGGR